MIDAVCGKGRQLSARRDGTDWILGARVIAFIHLLWRIWHSPGGGASLWRRALHSPGESALELKVEHLSATSGNQREDSFSSRALSIYDGGVRSAMWPGDGQDAW